MWMAYNVQYPPVVLLLIERSYACPIDITQLLNKHINTILLIIFRVGIYEESIF